MPWFQEARQDSLMAKIKEGIQDTPASDGVKPAEADTSAPTDVPEGDIDGEECGEEGEEEEPDDDAVEEPDIIDSDEMINGPDVE